MSEKDVIMLFLKMTTILLLMFIAGTYLMAKYFKWREKRESTDELEKL